MMVSNHPSSQYLRHFKQTGMPVCSTYSGFMRHSKSLRASQLADLKVIILNNKITKFAAFSGSSPIKFNLKLI